MPEGAAQEWNESVVEHVVSQCMQGQGFFYRTEIPGYCEHAGVAVQELGEHDIPINPAWDTSAIYQYYVTSNPNIICPFPNTNALCSGPDIDYLAIPSVNVTFPLGWPVGVGPTGMLIVDRYSNVYGAGGLSGGLGFAGSSSFSGYFGSVNQFSTYSLYQQFGIFYIMPETVLKEYLQGTSVSGGVQGVTGGNVALTPSQVKDVVNGIPVQPAYMEIGTGFDVGISITVSYTWLISE